MRAAVNSLRSCGESNSWNSWRSSCYWPRIPWRSGAATKRMNETTDEHGAAQPQPKLWSTVRFGVRQLAAAFVRVELLRLRKGASKLAHSKEDAPRMLEKSLPRRLLREFVICHWSLVILKKLPTLPWGLPHSTKRPYFKRRASFNSI